MLSFLLTLTVGCPESQTVIPDGYMEECENDSGCQDGFVCVENPHASVQGNELHCSTACETAADCPEGTLSCQPENSATCADGFCDYAIVCI